VPLLPLLLVLLLVSLGARDARYMYSCRHMAATAAAAGPVSQQWTNSCRRPLRGCFEHHVMHNLHAPVGLLPARKLMHGTTAHAAQPQPCIGAHCCL
jgi:hypothetical protein